MLATEMRPFLLSGDSGEALASAAAALREWLAGRPGTDLQALAAALAAAPAQRHRAAVLGSEPGEILDGLEALARRMPHDAVVSGEQVEGGIAFVVPGLGSQWPGMEAALSGVSEGAGESMRAAIAALEGHVEWPMTPPAAGEERPDWHETGRNWTLLFAISATLAQLWKSFGVEPGATLGHSIGEVPAAFIAGGMGLEEAAMTSGELACGLRRIPVEGVMAIAALPAAELEQRLAGREGVELSARMSPRISGLGGDAEAVRELLAELKEEGAFATELDLGVRAIHTSHVELVREAAVARLAAVRPRSGTLPFYSSYAGGRVETSELDAEFWVSMARHPVLFEAAVAAAIADGTRTFIELSPSPILAIPIQEVGSREGVVTLGSLRKGEGGADRFLRALAEAQVNGVAVDWSPLLGGVEPVALPGAVLEPAAASAADPGRAAADAGAAAAPTDLDAAELQATAAQLIVRQLAAVLGVAADAIDRERSFTDLGVDSARATEICAALSEQLGVRVPASAAFDFPTVTALAGFICGEAGAGSANGAGPVRRHVFDEEPIAIVGMSCRFPGGVTSPQELWEMVAVGRDGISGFPDDRGWDLEKLFHPDPAKPGSTYTRDGGFIYDASEFDAEFFGISPREALAMDPQQRHLLEGVWEAIEDVGVDPADLHGAEVGIFAGVSTQDYSAAARFSGQADEALEGYMITGAPTSVVSGRIAYSLGLRGPTMTVDTACSSSLVAIHLACQALRAGECATAIAGGATVLGTPTVFTEFSRQQAISADGRCKSFAECADGVGFSEGVGMVVLERLSDARRAGHRVLATVCGSAVNQDGASNGLIAPNGPAQERLILQALANARLSAAEVDAVEAHGTGTVLGDPIEAGALLATYGQEREKPLKLGSLKSNIGHSQAAAGVGGVIKSVMALREGLLPQTLHVDAPSSEIEWERGKIELLRESEPWERNGHPRRIGISAFGISGTNAHLILEEAPEPEPRPAAPAASPPLPERALLFLSAKTDAALREQGARLAAHLRANPGLDPRDVAYSLAATRSGFEQRAVCLGEGSAELLAGLDALAAGEPGENLLRGSARAERDPVFLFAGQGPQHARMAAELLEQSPIFAAEIEACEAALSPHVDWSLSEVLRTEDGAWMERLDVVQPALFAVMVSLARLWEACGVRPSLVAGHSQGEIAAAHVAGALSLRDAALIVSARSSAMAKIAGKGAMASVSLPASELEALLAPYGERLSLAAINGPASQAVSGEPEAIAELLAHCEAKEIRAQRIAVDYAAHSAQIDALREELIEAFAPISPRGSELPFHSTVTGERIDTAELGPEYWFENLRRTVLMEPVLSQMIEQGRTSFIEVSAHPILAFGLEEAAGAAEVEVAVVPSLRREEGGAERFARSLGQAKAEGVRVDPDALFPGASTVALPTYPFQRKSYWLQSTGAAGDLGAAGLADAGHPLLGASIEDPESGRLTFTGRLSLQTHSWLGDHALGEQALLPGTGFVELALHAAEQVGAGGVAELTLEAPLLLPAQGAMLIQVAVGPAPEDGGEEREIAIHSRAQEEDAPWIRNATGLLGAADPEPALPAGQWPPAGAEAVEVDGLYGRFADSGFAYGPDFQGLTAAWRLGEEVYAEISLTDEQAREAERYSVHPALLDAALHSIAIAMEGEGGGQAALPFSWQGVSVAATGASELRVVLRRSGSGRSLSLFDAAGAPLGEVRELTVRPIDPGQLQASGSGQGLLELHWRQLELEGPEDAAATAWRCLADPALPAPERARAAFAATLEKLQQFLAETEAAAEGGADAEGGAERRLAIVTEGAVSVAAGESPDPAAAAVWGLVRSAQSEHPGRFALIDSDGSEESEAALAQALALSASEPQIALRAGSAQVARLAKLAAPDDEQLPALDPARTVLVTGATGTLGGLVARHLVSEHGARRLLLVSRSGESAAGAPELRAELEELGAAVAIAACDVSERGAVEALLEGIDPEHPLSAVVHAAGGLADATVENLSAERLEPTFAPKADAAWNLHELCLDLDAFVLFSSAAGTLGGPGQGNYAAANCFVDALAAARKAEGLPATSIAWGYWERESGLTAKMGDADRARLRRSGVAPLSDEQGLALFDASLRAGGSNPLAIGIEPAGLRTLAEAGMLPPLFSELVRVPRRRAAAAGSLATKLAALPESERQEQVAELICAEIAAVLGHDSSEQIDPDRAFSELGFDSLAAVELRNRLASLTGLRLPPTTVFDYPTPAKLADHVYEGMAGTAPAQQAGLGAVEGELNRLQSLLARIESEEEQELAAARLRELLASLDEAGGDAVEEQLTGASDEEMFELLDQKLGRV